MGKALQKIIFIVGPTAVGKSDVAFNLAKKIKGEIVSCDSMQVYKEIDIASNKPDAKTLKLIPHHLINIISVEDYFDVAQFNKLTLSTIKEIHKKNKIPIVAGGSGLYMQILLDGIFEGREYNKEIRAELKQAANEKGLGYLYNLLKDKDPDIAKKTHPNDLKRIVRALEVAIVERKPISQMHKEREGLWGKYDIVLFCLNKDRAKLYQDINARVDKMFAQGLIKEIEFLKKKKLSYTAESMIGVKEVLNYLNGEYDIEKANEEMKKNTRHYAKRQLTWFRREKRLKWIDVMKNETAVDVANRIYKEIQ